MIINSEYVMPTYGRFQVIFEEGKGSWLYDVDGNRYLDFVSGVAVNCLGHSPIEVVETIKDQADKITHISNLYWNKPQLELAKKLIDLSDLNGETMKDVFFCNSGTEAMEGALKIAKKYGNQKSKSKTKIVYMKESFHGRSLGALSVTGQPKYQSDFYPLIPDVVSCTFNDCAELQSVVDDNTCAILIEPVQGEGGINIASKEFLQAARELSLKHDCLIIFDEVQCGASRLGSFYAYKLFDIMPDVVCMAKGLGGGVPIGAIIAGKRASVLSKGDHGSTYGGNPLVCSVANKVIDKIADNEFVNEINKKYEYFIDKLKNIIKRKSEIVGIKGKGLLLGMKVKGEPKDFVQKAFEKKLLLIGAGKDVVRILPPLNVKYEEIDEFFNIIDEIFK